MLGRASAPLGMLHERPAERLHRGRADAGQLPDRRLPAFIRAPAHGTDQLRDVLCGIVHPELWRLSHAQLCRQAYCLMVVERSTREGPNETRRMAYRDAGPGT